MSKKTANAPSFLTPTAMRGVAAVLIIAVVFVFVIWPIPVQAGGGGWLSSVVGIFLGLFISALCLEICAPFVIAIMFSTPVMIIGGASTVFGVVKGAVDHATCSGSYDPLFGTCREHRQETQQVFTTTGAKFNKITMSGVPTPEEFSRNPNGQEKVIIEWTSVGRPGTINTMKIKDKSTKTIVCTSSGNSCSSGAMTDTCMLPYEKGYVAEVIFASCWQVAAKEVRPTCSGCGWDTVGAKKEFTTSSLPLPGADIKADGKDSIVFKAGTPARL